MVKKLHIGNLSYSVTDEELKSAFETCGSVESVAVVKDKRSGRSKGFGFVEMSTDAEAAQAIEKLNKTELNGRMIFVSESTPKAAPARPGRRSEFGARSGSRHFDRKSN